MQTYVVFLRGINVGGNTMIKMVDLKASFEAAGFENVKTVIASGNVIFDSNEQDSATVTKIIRGKLKETFGFDISVMVRTRKEIEELVAADPFKSIPVTKQTRLYVTFLSDPESIKKSTLTIPYATSDNAFQILRITKSEVCSVIVLLENRDKRGTLQLMDIIEKEYGHNVTTRNWNTIVKIANLLE